LAIASCAAGSTSTIVVPGDVVGAAVAGGDEAGGCELVHEAAPRTVAEATSRAGTTGTRIIGHPLFGVAALAAGGSATGFRPRGTRRRGTQIKRRAPLTRRDPYPVVRRAMPTRLSPSVRSDTFRQVLAVGEHNMLSPAGLARTPTGGFYVSSVATGVINEYDANWGFVRTILQPPAGEKLTSTTYSTGTPLGIGVAPDGTIFYADIGVIVDPKNGFGPKDGLGHVRRITFTDGKPNPPEIMGSNLDYPDGIGIWNPR
jgi:hypothetical protein